VQKRILGCRQPEKPEPAGSLRRFSEPQWVGRASCRTRLFPALHGNCPSSSTKHGLFQLNSKSRRLAYAQHRAAFIGRSHRSCASATLFPPAMDEASRGQPSTFNRAYWIEYSSRQLRDFTRPAMQADLKKPNGATTLTWASMAMHSTKTTGGPARNTPRSDAGGGTLMSH
jgi:hypothetical protein